MQIFSIGELGFIGKQECLLKFPKLCIESLQMHLRRNWAKATSSSASVSSNPGSNQSETREEIHQGKDEYCNGDLIACYHCHEECQIVTSWTESNPSRRFHGYKKYGVIFSRKYFNYENLTNFQEVNYE